MNHDPPRPGSALHVEQRVQPSDVHEGRRRQVDRQVRAQGFAAQALLDEGDQHRSREPVELPDDVQDQPAAVQAVQVQAEVIVVPGRPLRDQRGTEGAVRDPAGVDLRTRARFISASAHPESTICAVVLRWTARSCSTERR